MTLLGFMAWGCQRPHGVDPQTYLRSWSATMSMLKVLKADRQLQVTADSTICFSTSALRSDACFYLKMARLHVKMEAIKRRTATFWSQTQ